MHTAFGLLDSHLALRYAASGTLGWRGQRGDKQPLSLAGYRLSGSTSVGYRWVDIDSGRKQLYDEVVNLDEGVRLFNFTLRGDRLGPDSTIVDHFSLDATDIGDPYPKIQFHVAKDEVYKFNVTCAPVTISSAVLRPPSLTITASTWSGALGISI